MFSGSTNPKTTENEITGNKRLPCPLHGCRRVYHDQSALETHLKEHEIPAQSLPGKVLMCSSGGCSGSFPDMQRLMEHMRHHHKLNIFFQCESCRTKLRSYRGLLTHLHTCSKVPRAKPKLPEPAWAPPTAAAVDPSAMDQLPSQPEPASVPQQVPAQAMPPNEPFPATGPQPEPAAPFLPAPCGPPPQETPQPPSLTEAAPTATLADAPFNLPPSLDGPNAMPAPLETQGPVESRPPELVQPAPAPAPAPHSPLAAVWRKSQGMPTNRRILWEHTRGRYTCLQCGHIMSNLKEMTQHVSSQHSGTKAAEDAGNPPANT